MLRTIILPLFAALVLAGCATYGSCGNESGGCRGDTVSVGELQERVYEYGESVERFKLYLDAIRERATSNEVTIDGVIELFAEYDRAVGILVQDYYSLRTRIRAKGDASGQTGDRP